MSISPEGGVMEGRSATLTCESDANPPVRQYYWFDWNNHDLQHMGQTLRLEHVKVKHSGSYWCQGANRLGMGRSLPSTLSVYCKPFPLLPASLLAWLSCGFPPGPCWPSHSSSYPMPYIFPVCPHGPTQPVHPSCSIACRCQCPCL